MYIESTKENLFNLDDVYESLIVHCGLEYAESVMRLVNKEKEQTNKDKEQSLLDKIAMLESDYDDMECQVISMQCIIEDAISQLEYILHQSSVNKSAVVNVYNTLCEAL